MVVWEALEHVRRDDRSPKQVAEYMKREGRHISYELICRYVRADESGESAGHCRHGMKYDRHGRPDRTVKVGNISGRTSIHDRSEEADSRHSGDWENGYDSGQERQGRDTHPHGMSDRLHSHGGTRVRVRFFLYVHRHGSTTSFPRRSPEQQGGRIRGENRNQAVATV